ncbi:MAG: hypothetical protein VB957_03310 [Pseudomonadales bacterium]
MKKYLRYGGLGIVFLWFFGGGVMHFINPDIFVAIVPPWVPYALAAVYISGFFEVVLALLIIWPKSRPMAGWGLVALTIAVTPANVHMWLHPELFPEVDPSDLSVRLVIQVVLLFTIWWSTRIEQKGLEETGPGTLPGSTT